MGAVRAANDVDRLAEDIRAPVVVGAAAPAGRRLIDLGALIGDLYGALGVLQVAVAAALLGGADGEAPSAVAVVCGDLVDGWRAVELTRWQGAS